MLYLLGGAPRSGKSRIAAKFTTDTGISSFGLDYLVMGLARGIPEYGVDPFAEDKITASKLWPVVQGITSAIIENKQNYLLEGACLWPEYVAELCTRFDGQFRACFIGFAEVDSGDKLREIRRFGGGPDDWLKDHSDEMALRHISRLKELSCDLKNACDTYNIKYIDNSVDDPSTVQDVVRYLVEGTQ